MTVDIFSKHIGSASELLLAADVKQGFIPYRRTMTYASRLRTFLRLVSEPRARSIDGNERGIFVTPIDRLRTLYLVRWTLFDNDRRLLLAVTFDQPIGPYIRQIVDEGGPLLDTILCHTTDYEGHSTDLGYKCFLQYAETHQIEADLFTASFPQLTSDDYNFLIGAQEIHDEFADVARAQHTALTAHRWNAAETDLKLAKYRLETPGAKAHRMLSDPATRSMYQQQALRLVRAVHYASRYFPDPDPANPGAGPDPASKDHIFYRDFARFLVEQVDFDAIQDADKAAFAIPLTWLKNGPTHLTPLPVRPPQKQLVAPGNVQGDIVRAYKTEPAGGQPMNAGVMLLVRFKNSAAGGAFLRNISNRITTAASPQNDDIRVNMALTYRGLKTLSVPEDQRLKFPADFREGMAGRAGMLGDVGTNSPSVWNPRRHNAEGEDAGALDLEMVDAVVQLQIRVENAEDQVLHDWTAAHPLFARATELAADGIEILAVERMVRYQRNNGAGPVFEHFGFDDGLSNPKINDDTNDPNYAPLGSVILGYDDDNSVELPPLQRDGSYMVMRKMFQNVGLFSGLNPDVQAKMMGRTPGGAPLTDPANTDNSFDYSGDGEGLRCPFSAHIRRANPRWKMGKDPTTGEISHHDTPRIMRRGYTYGPKVEAGAEPDEIDRGIIFTCYNASIGEQYEVIQRWIGGGNATGIYSAHNDPVMGPGPTVGNRTFRFVSDNGATVERVTLSEDPYVRLVWGLYTFVPSIAAINMIAGWAETAAITADSEQDALAARGAAIVGGLRTIEDWKRVLEDGDPRNRDKGDAVMAHINRDHAGVYKAWHTPGPEGAPTDYFVIVSNPDRVMEIFRDTVNYSNRAYWRRMKDAMGAVYLGMDPQPQNLWDLTRDPRDQEFETTTVDVYDRTSGDVNPFLSAFTEEGMQRRIFYTMVEKVKNSIDGDGDDEDDKDDVPSEVDPEVPNPTPSGKEPRRKLIDMEELIGATLADFGLKWLGLPGSWLKVDKLDPALPDEIITRYPHRIDDDWAPPGTPKSPDAFQEMAAYFFGPWPLPDYKVRADVMGQRLISRIMKWLKRSGNSQLPGDTLIGKLRDSNSYTDQQIVELALNSAVGLNAPTCASFAGITYDWVKEGTLWRLQQEYLDAVKSREDPFDAAVRVLRGPMIDSMAKFAGPKHLHRICAQPGVSIAGVDIEPGKRVVMALGPAAQRCPHADRAAKEEILFGGLNSNVNPPADVPVHACPGRDLAMTLMMVAMAALMTSGQIVRNSSMTLFVRTDEDDYSDMRADLTPP